MGKFDLPDCYVLIDLSCSPLCVSIILPEYGRREIVFSGSVPDRKDLVQRHQLAHVYDVSDLPRVVNGSLVLSPSTIYKDSDHELVSTLVDIKYSYIVEQAFIEARFLKTVPELEYLTYSSRAAAKVHQLTEKLIKSTAFISESSIASFFVHQSTILECELQSYNPIVGASRHGAILHFPTGQTPDGGHASINQTDFILIDAAPAFRGYASDLTRTYIRKPTEKYQILSQIVLDSQQAGIRAHEIGNTWGDVVNASLVQLTLGLWEHGFLIGDSLDELVESGVVSIFMPHGLGHPVGLDVHDPAPAIHNIHQKHKSLGLWNEYPLKLARDYPLAKGQVHTVEPGAYFIPYLLQQAKNETLGVSKFLNWSQIEEWKGLGGVRIEDVVAIDHEGISKVITN